MVHQMYCIYAVRKMYCIYMYMYVARTVWSGPCFSHCQWNQQLQKPSAFHRGTHVLCLIEWTDFGLEDSKVASCHIYHQLRDLPTAGFCISSDFSQAHTRSNSDGMAGSPSISRQYVTRLLAITF